MNKFRSALNVIGWALLLLALLLPRRFGVLFWSAFAASTLVDLVLEWRPTRNAILWCVPLLRVFALGKKVIFVDGELYLTRYYMTPRVALWRRFFPDVYLHNIHAADGERDLHCHPWSNSRSTILRGYYFEERQEGSFIDDRIYDVGDVNEIAADTYHRIVDIDDRGVWTLFRASPRTGKGWGFRDFNGTYRAVDAS